MIDKKGNLKCDGCGKKLGEITPNGIAIVCPKSTCKRYNVFDTEPKQYISHKALNYQ